MVLNGKWSSHIFILFFMDVITDMEGEEDKEDEKNRVPGCESCIELK